ncbi:MAG: hypothetical protein U1F83_19575 [Verrucomicrobiota bacterium]
MAEVVAHFKIHGIGAQATLTAPHKGTDAKVRNYFYRKNCKVSLRLMAPGVRLVLCNGFNTTGIESVREEQRKSRQSHRLPHESTLDEILESHEFAVGQSLIVKGNGSNIRALLSKKFGPGAVAMQKHGDGWNITRLR